MKKIFFTPGPSQLYPTVNRYIKEALALNIPSISHRGDKFHEIYSGAIAQFKKLYRVPKGHYVFFLSSATEAMERIIENLVIKDSLHFVNGSFSNLFYKVATSLSINTKKIEVPMGEGFDFNKLKIPINFEIACFTQNETSTGVMIPMEDIYSFQKRFPKSLIALDIVSSAPFVNVDFSLIDCVFFSVQKGFGLPAGLGVLILKPNVINRAMSVKKKKTSQGSYHSFENYLKYYEKNETPETPNVLNIYLFGKVCQDMNKKGLNAIRKETIIKARKIYYLTQKNNKFTPFVKEERFRSLTVAVLNIAGGSKQILNYLKEKGYIVGSGYKDFKDKQIRIANFPQHSLEDVESLLSLVLRYN